MSLQTLKPTILMLRRSHTTTETAATIEQIAEAQGIALDAKWSAAEVLELIEGLSWCPYITRFYRDGERRYFASERQGAAARSRP